jgi:hypothetical protein
LEQLERDEARKVWKGGGKRVVEDAQHSEVCELTDGPWDGMEPVVVEDPVKKKKKKKKKKVN